VRVRQCIRQNPLSLSRTSDRLQLLVPGALTYTYSFRRFRKQNSKSRSLIARELRDALCASSFAQLCDPPGKEQGCHIKARPHCI